MVTISIMQTNYTVPAWYNLGFQYKYVIYVIFSYIKWLFIVIYILCKENIKKMNHKIFKKFHISKFYCSITRRQLSAKKERKKPACTFTDLYLGPDFRLLWHSLQVICRNRHTCQNAGSCCILWPCRNPSANNIYKASS